MTDSEYESDSDSESDATEGANFNHLPDTVPRITDYTITNEAGSEIAKPENDYDLTTMKWNENIITSNNKKFQPRKGTVKRPPTVRWSLI